ncbi:Hypothetical protein, putative [Bodo saltans]|uniref:Uncharacterized protein n=1 Tax=Bodo saltans TaxID=75058 RepID=A0A0S4ISG5_BODSA|nr:Hypothetical protein, putative [Bodo saltans]|eukprot:CUG05849.1 Hypothetical protein, putative [Bodo saltans]
MDDFDLDSLVDRCLGVPPIGGMSSVIPTNAGVNAAVVSSSPAVSALRPSSYGSADGDRKTNNMSASLSYGTPKQQQQQTSYYSQSQQRGAGASSISKSGATPPPSVQHATTTVQKLHARSSPGDYSGATDHFSSSRQRNHVAAHSSSEEAGGSGALEIQSGGGLTGRSYESPGSSARQDPTLRRIQLWAERREAKRAVMVYEKLQEELAQCTFHPIRETTNLSDSSSIHLAPSSLYKDNKAWGFDEFVDRLVTARDQKQLKEEEDERRKSGATGVNWQPGFTVPEPFEFNRYNRRPIPSLKSHYEGLAPVLRGEHEQSLSTIEAPSIPPGLFSVRPSNVIMDHATPDRPR